MTNILIDQNNRRYRIATSGRKYFLCKFYDNNTLKYCERNLKKNGYCIGHKNGQEKKILIKSTLQPIKNKKEILIDQNNQRYYIISSGEKKLLCNFIDEKTLKYCENRRRKKEYCLKHKDGYEKDYSTKIIKNEDGTITYSNQKYREQQKNVTTIGDETEIYVLNIIKEFKEIKSCFKIGQTGDKCDIKYQFNNEDFERGLQVKTLTQMKYKKNSFGNSSCGGYDENTLLVFVNKERDKYALIYSQNCPKSVVFIFTIKSKTKYKDNIFTDIDEFKKQLLIYMKNSIKYKEQLCISHMNEKNSLLRLEEKCKENNLPFSLATTFISIYDCIINNFKIQCKFISTKDCEQYKCFLHKSGPEVNGKQTKIPYSDKDDIEFIIIEINDYKDQFYIIPVKELIDRGIFSSSLSKGMQGITIPPPGYTNAKVKRFWMLQYLNRFDLLK